MGAVLGRKFYFPFCVCVCVCGGGGGGGGEGGQGVQGKFKLMPGGVYCQIRNKIIMGRKLHLPELINYGYNLYLFFHLANMLRNVRMPPIFYFLKIFRKSMAYFQVSELFLITGFSL